VLHLGRRHAAGLGPPRHRRVRARGHRLGLPARRRALRRRAAPARRLFAAARAREGRYSAAFPEATHDCASTSFRDNLAPAAALLWRATGEAELRDAARAARAKPDFPADTPYLNWTRPAALAAAVRVRRRWRDGGRGGERRQLRGRLGGPRRGRLCAHAAGVVRRVRARRIWPPPLLDDRRLWPAPRRKVRRLGGQALSGRPRCAPRRRLRPRRLRPLLRRRLWRGLAAPPAPPRRLVPRPPRALRLGRVRVARRQPADALRRARRRAARPRWRIL
jgi:hypothetical protein